VFKSKVPLISSYQRI